mmetsp:Transcript_69112/g.214318  ORF Transcript_69112/g.214318 Transcript_69112/m.214318 type:complete len:253 (-) Transcript_69112:119-877(-)
MAARLVSFGLPKELVFAPAQLRLALSAPARPMLKLLGILRSTRARLFLAQLVLAQPAQAHPALVRATSAEVALALAAMVWSARTWQGLDNSMLVWLVFARPTLAQTVLVSLVLAPIPMPLLALACGALALRGAAQPAEMLLALPRLDRGAFPSSLPAQPMFAREELASLESGWLVPGAVGLAWEVRAQPVLAQTALTLPEAVHFHPVLVRLVRLAFARLPLMRMDAVRMSWQRPAQPCLVHLMLTLLSPPWL